MNRVFEFNFCLKHIINHAYNFIYLTEDITISDGKYDLIGIVNHEGSLNNGHYTAYHTYLIILELYFKTPI